jgi:hypothetical protein
MRTGFWRKGSKGLLIFAGKMRTVSPAITKQNKKNLLPDVHDFGLPAGLGSA